MPPSSEILVVGYPAVAKALSFIWKFYTQRIGVDDVVNEHIFQCGSRSHKSLVGLCKPTGLAGNIPRTDIPCGRD